MAGKPPTAATVPANHHLIPVLPGLKPDFMQLLYGASVYTQFMEYYYEPDK